MTYQFTIIWSRKFKIYNNNTQKITSVGTYFIKFVEVVWKETN